MHESYFTVQLALSQHIDDLYEDNLGALPKQAVYEHIKDETQHDGIDDEVDLFENKTAGEFAYAGPTHNEACRRIQKAFAAHEEPRIRRLIDSGCNKVFIALFREPHERVMNNFYTPIYEVV